MRKWYAEPYRFRLTVLEVGKDGDPRQCRAGHEPGDVMEFDYCTPAGLCGEIFFALVPVLHTFRTDVDMRRNFGWKEPDRKVMWCPARVVKFELRRFAAEAERVLGVADA